jgi:thiamine pyrophosphate-dependent acetolactate synthase large subunit-like protein
MSPQELDRAAAFMVELIVVVIDDGGYGAEFHKLEVKEVAAPVGVTFDTSRIPDIARAYGATVTMVRTPEELENCRDLIEGSPGVRLVDIQVTPRTHLSWHAESNRSSHARALRRRVGEAR